MRTRRETRIEELLEHLERIESAPPRPQDSAIFAIARDAILEEISRLAREQSLRIFPQGDTLSAVSLAG